MVAEDGKEWLGCRCCHRKAAATAGAIEGCNARQDRMGTRITHVLPECRSCQMTGKPAWEAAAVSSHGAETRVRVADLGGQRLDHAADGAGAEVRLQVLTQLEQLLGRVGGHRGDGGGGQRREAVGR